MADKKISLTNLDKIIKWNKEDDVRTVQFEIGENEFVDVQVKHTISMTDMSEFVDIVADSVFVTTENGEEIYDPSKYYFAYGLCFIEYYTNLKLNIGFDRFCDMEYCSKIMSKLKEQASSAQLCDIDDSIYNAIEFRKQMALSGERVRLQYITEQLDKALPMLEQNASLLAGVKPEDMTAAVQTLGNMDETKLAQEVLRVQDSKVVDNVIEMQKAKKPRARKKKTEDVD